MYLFYICQPDKWKHSEAKKKKKKWEFDRNIDQLKSPKD